MSGIPRRNFLRWSVLGTGLGIGMRLVKPAAAAAAVCGDTPRFRALVCIEQLGGCDPFLFASPTDTARKAALIARRGSGLTSYYDDPALLHLGYGQNVALHPGLYPLQSYLPKMRVTLGSLNAMHVSHSRSHEIAQLRMALGTAEGGINNTGWMARLFDSGAKLVGFVGAKDQDFFCQSLRCKQHPPLVTNRFEDFKLDGVNFHALQGGSNNSKQVAAVLREMSSLSVSRPISSNEQRYRDALASMFAEVDSVQSLLSSYVTPKHSEYLVGDPAYNEFANRFRNIAQYIRYMACTGATDRIVFVVPHGGYDMHSNYATASQTLMSQLGGVLRTFIDDLVAMGLWDDVVITSLTDFGRQFAANGTGLDHGDAHATLTLGGRVRGGANAVFGEMPSASQIETANAWPAELDSRALLATIIQQHLGLDPYVTAFPGEIGAQFSVPDFSLFT